MAAVASGAAGGHEPGGGLDPHSIAVLMPGIFGGESSKYLLGQRLVVKASRERAYRGHAANVSHYFQDVGSYPGQLAQRVNSDIPPAAGGQQSGDAL